MAWEIQIKLHVGKLKLARPLGEVLNAQVEQNGFNMLPITLPHVLTLADFPLHHRDPFDRLLAAQAQAEGAMLVTRDPAFTEYDVPTLW